MKTMSTEEFIDYLRRVATDLRENGSEATAEDYEEAARRLEILADFEPPMPSRRKG